MNIYAVSSASEAQQSFGGYCTPDEIVNNKHIKTCLGDMFTTNLIEYIERVVEVNTTLDTLFKHVN